MPARFRTRRPAQLSHLGLVAPSPAWREAPAGAVALAWDAPAAVLPFFSRRAAAQLVLVFSLRVSVAPSWVVPSLSGSEAPSRAPEVAPWAVAERGSRALCWVVSQR